MAVGDIRFVSQRGEWRFAAPETVIAAVTAAEVRPCLAQVAAAVARGRHAAGFLTYEAAPAFDPAMRTRPPGPLPAAWFGLYRHAPAVGPPLADCAGDTVRPGRWSPRLGAATYRAALRRIHALIVAGDVYQVNYTFPLRTAFAGDPVAWFERLCRAQQADYCVYADTGRFRLLSASPELFFRLERGTLVTRPMKGTARRGRTPAADRRAAAALAASPKERAENIMIVDLLRNDMARVSAPGSVCVRRLCQVERYPTLWQMTSTIAARTNAGVPEILAALFPSGSVTGAPKIRAMEIIRDLEPFPRGLYCGTLGWWAPDGRAVFNVAIRTATLDTATGRAEYAVGGGITHDSNSRREYDECLAKAAILGSGPQRRLSASHVRARIGPRCSPGPHLLDRRPGTGPNMPRPKRATCRNPPRQATLPHAAGSSPFLGVPIAISDLHICTD